MLVLNGPIVSAGALLRPFSVGYIKGWRRSLVLLMAIQAVRELELEAQLEHRILVSWQAGARIPQVRLESLYHWMCVRGQLQHYLRKLRGVQGHPCQGPLFKRLSKGQRLRKHC